MSKQPPYIDITTSNSTSGIPPELKTSWVNLAKYGVSERKLAKFDGYLNGNSKLDEETMDAALRVGNIFPDSTHPAYFPLQNYVFAKLHERYHQASEEEKKGIVTITSNLFIQTHKKILDRRMQAIGDNWESYIDENYQKKVEVEAIKNALEYAPREGIDIGAMIATTVKNAQIAFIETIVARTGKRKAFANPSSIDETYDDGTPVHQFVDSRGSELDVLLQKEINVANAKAKKILNNPPEGLLLPREAKFLGYYMQAVNAEQEPDMNDIAAKLGISRTSAYNIKDAVFSKIQAHVITENKPISSGTLTTEHEENINNLQRLGRIKKSTLIDAGLTPNEWKIVNAVTAMPEEQVSYPELAKEMGLKNATTLHRYVTNIHDKVDAIEQKKRPANESTSPPPKNVLQQLKKAIDGKDLTGIALIPKQRELIGVIHGIPYEDLNAKQIEDALNIGEATIRYHAKVILSKTKTVPSHISECR